MGFDSALHLSICLGVGVIGGFTLGIYFWALEHFWYHLLSYLENRKLIKRLEEHIPVTANNYTTESFWAVSTTVIIPMAVIYAGRKGCFFSLDIAGAWRFTWIMMFLHDVYFWLVHTMLHKVKYLYRTIHYLHHSTFGGISAFSTAYGTVLDNVIPFTPFLCWLTWRVCLSPKWNIFHMAFFITSITNVHVMGHSGYLLPAWIYVPGSLGISLTPGAQRPIHHYVHHLDPRFNKSLYFTWCDRIAGTYKDQLNVKQPKENLESGIEKMCQTD